MKKAICLMVLFSALLFSFDISTSIENDDMISYYVNALSMSEENFIKREIRRYRSFPYLDRYYRLQKEGKTSEAAAELEKYLKVSPDDVGMRAVYMNFLFNTGKYADVLEQADIITSRRPGFAPALFFKAEAYVKLNDDRKAMKAFVEASKAEGVRMKDKLYALDSAINAALRLNDYQSAYDLSKEYTSLAPGSSSFMREGEILVKMNQNSKAIEAFEKAKSFAKNDEDRHSAAKAAYFAAARSKDRKKAIAELTELLDKDKNNRELLQELLYLYVAEKDYHKADEIAAGSNDPKIHMQYAVLLFNDGRYDKALRSFNDLLKKTSDIQIKRSCLEYVSAIYEKQRKYAEAASSLKAALKYAGKDQNKLRLRILDIYVKSARYSEAMQEIGHIEASSLSKKETAHLLRQKSVVYEKTGDYNNAAAALEEAMRIGADQEFNDYLQLAYLNEKRGDIGAAAKMFETALEFSRSLKKKAEIHEALGFLYERQGLYEQAIEAYKKALALDSSRSGSVLNLAFLLFRKRDFSQAALYADIILGSKGVDKSAKRKALEIKADIFRETNEPEKSIALYKQYLSEYGEDENIYVKLGLSYQKQNEWSLASEMFYRAVKIRESLFTYLYLALNYKKIGKNGMAIYYGEKAKAFQDGSDKENLALLLRSLGYWRADAHQYEKAARSFEAALKVKEDEKTRLALSRQLRLAGRTAEAKEIFDKVSVEKLEKEDKGEYYLEKAEFHALDKDFRNAVVALKVANSFKYDPDNDYKIGLYYVRLSDQSDAARKEEPVDLESSRNYREQAIGYFEAAAKNAPSNITFATTLGYAYEKEGRYEDAAKTFERVVEYDKDDFKTFETLGYIYKKAFQNDRAIENFKKAIDTHYIPKDMFRIRNEISKLEKPVNITAYMSYRSNSAQQIVNYGGSGIGSLPGGAGLEIAYRPPVIGFRDEKIFEVFGRVFWNNKLESFAPSSDTYQASLGLRYKPLRTENLWFSAERLFKIGLQTQDDWLFRALYSKSFYSEIEYDTKIKNFSHVYGELNYYVRPSSTSFYFDARQGVTFNIENRLHVIPNVVFDLRYQTPFAPAGSYIEGGAGAIIKYFLGKSKYENYKAMLEFDIYYKYGVFADNRFRFNNQKNFNGVVFTGVFRY